MLAYPRKSFYSFKRRPLILCFDLCSILYKFPRAGSGLSVVFVRHTQYPDTQADECAHMHRVLENPHFSGGFRLTDFLRQLDGLHLKFVIVLPICCHFDRSFSS